MRNAKVVINIKILLKRNVMLVDIINLYLEVPLLNAVDVEALQLN